MSLTGSSNAPTSSLRTDFLSSIHSFSAANQVISHFTMFLTQ